MSYIFRYNLFSTTQFCFLPLAALQEGRIRGAALDVFENEPLPDASPLWGEGLKDRVLLSPHCADLTPTFMEEALEQFVDNVKLYAAGKPLCNVVDKQAGY